MIATDIDTVRQKLEQQLIDLPGVTGIAIGEKGGKQVIKVLVEREEHRRALREEGVVPETLDGYETDVEVTGPFVAENSVDAEEDS